MDEGQPRPARPRPPRRLMGGVAPRVPRWTNGPPPPPQLRTGGPARLPLRPHWTGGPVPRPPHPHWTGGPVPRPLPWRESTRMGRKAPGTRECQVNFLCLLFVYLLCFDKYINTA